MTEQMMKRWTAWVVGVCMAAVCGAAAAQTRVDSTGVAQAGDRPVNRFYGTARPQAPGAPPPPAHIAPPSSIAPPAVIAPPPGARPIAPPGSVYVPPPAIRPPAYRPPAYYHSRPNVGVDVVIGAPWPRPYPYYPGAWGWPGYPPPVVVSPPIVVSPPPPLVYVERPRDDEVPAAGYWYWCGEPQGWYPDVGECAQGWQPVLPRAAQ
jgi:hypothetical protein